MQPNDWTGVSKWVVSTPQCRWGHVWSADSSTPQNVMFGCFSSNPVRSEDISESRGRKKCKKVRKQKSTVDNLETKMPEMLANKVNNVFNVFFPEHIITNFVCLQFPALIVTILFGNQKGQPLVGCIIGDRREVLCPSASRRKNL